MAIARPNQVRYSQRHIWRWRDWTIESLNQNKPYDRMIVEMLAGDELAPGDPDVVRATGYLARNWYMFNRNVWLQDTVEYTSAGVPRHHAEVRALPHPQIRSDSARRLLPLPRVL